MWDITDDGFAWLADAFGMDRHAAGAWNAAPWQRSQLPTGRIFDAIGVDSERACGLLDRFIEYGLRAVPIAMVDGTMYVLVRPGSAEIINGLSARNADGDDLPVMLFASGDSFTAPPLDRRGDDSAFWLVPPTGKPELPLASVVLAALASLPGHAGATKHSPEPGRRNSG